MPRLDRILARNLGLSRREVTRAFRQKAFSDLAGIPLDDPRSMVRPSDLPVDILWRGRACTLHHEFAVMQHKPLGVITAMADPRHRTAYDVLPLDLPLRGDLRAVGRLDKDTSGLLLWTTDGELLHRITHPRYAIPRCYHAALAAPYEPPPPDFALEDGYHPRILALETRVPDEVHPALNKPPSATTYATITIASGRFHEVRRIFAALGTHVEALCRVSFGPLQLPEDLPPEGCRPLDLKAVFRGLHPLPPDAINPEE